MIKRKNLLQIDLVVQLLLFISIPTLIGLFFLGVWQVAGSILWHFGTKDIDRKKYFGVVVLYFLSVGFISLFFEAINENILVAFWWIGLVVAFGIGIWYFRLTQAAFDKAKEDAIEMIDDPTILDLEIYD